MDRDNRRAGQRERQGVLEVAEVGAEPAEQPRQGQRHPQLLGGRPEPDRLDPVGNEVGAARDRGEPKAGLRRERRQLAEQVEHVRLVAGPPAAEHVRVDDDEGLHASSLAFGSVAVPPSPLLLA